MNDSTPALRSEPEPLADSDYDTILAAVMETARGRWFLREYAHRNRNADTGMLLTAISRIESLLQSREAVPQSASLAEAPANVPTILMQMRDIAENLIECGAPTYLCNDLLRRIEEMALAYTRPAEPPPVEPAPETAVSLPIVEMMPVEPVRDPFADILALTPEERIALFT
jgi:hypothetical protein